MTRHSLISAAAVYPLHHPVLYLDRYIAHVSNDAISDVTIGSTIIVSIRELKNFVSRSIRPRFFFVLFIFYFIFSRTNSWFKRSNIFKKPRKVSLFAHGWLQNDELQLSTMLYLDSNSQGKVRARMLDISDLPISCVILLHSDDRLYTVTLYEYP